MVQERQPIVHGDGVLLNERRYTARIFRVTYRSGHVRRLASVLVKVPYGGIFAMTEVLSRALAIGEIEWFRIERPARISDTERAGLVRWTQAFAETSKTTLVSWTA